MYNIYYENNNGKMPVINIEGKLDSVDDIVRIMAEVYNLNKNRDGKEKKKSVIINLAKADAITEECLKMFKRLQPVYNLEFQNYSLYLEVVLRDYKLLIDGENSEQQKEKII